MDNLVNFISIAIGLWLVYSGYKLVKYQDLKMLYDKKSYEHIEKKYLNDYAISLGKTLFMLGICFIIANLLFFINHTIIFIIAEIIMIGGIIVGVILIYRINKKYEKKEDR